MQASDPKYANVSFVSFFVFIGTAMSITAFPVLARILKEGGLIYTAAGSMAMGAAALNDAAAWCLLVLAISLGKERTGEEKRETERTGEEKRETERTGEERDREDRI